MKSRILSIACILLSAFVPAALFAAPETKKKGGKSDSANITCAQVWTKKAKDYAGKSVTTFVIEIGSTGTVMSDAPAAVVPVQTGNKNQDEGGEILVLVPAEDFEKFVKKFRPTSGKEDSAFGGRIEYKKLTAEFSTVGGVPVLLFNVKADALKDFSPEEALEKQLGAEGDSAPVPEGYERKVFHVSKIGKKPYTKAEFTRLVGLYNKSVPKNERMKEAEIRSLLEDAENTLSVLDEKAKIEWQLRK